MMLFLNSQILDLLNTLMKVKMIKIMIQKMICNIQWLELQFTWLQRLLAIKHMERRPTYGAVGLYSWRCWWVIAHGKDVQEEKKDLRRKHSFTDIQRAKRICHSMELTFHKCVKTF